MRIAPSRSPDSEVLDDGESALAPGFGESGAELLGGAFPDGGEGAGRGLAQPRVGEELAEGLGDLGAASGLELLAQVGLDALRPAAELGGDGLGELGARFVVLELAHVDGEGVEGVVGLVVVALAGLDEQVDEAEDAFAAALVDLCDGLLDLVLVDLAEQASLIRVGHLLDEGFQLCGSWHLVSPSIGNWQSAMPIGARGLAWAD